MNILSLFFFFSSRRRHTRYIGDWSSDVCSSDLRSGRGETARTSHRECRISPRQPTGISRAPWRGGLWIRSEERRVGKECRYQWWSFDYKKKKNKYKVEST